MDDIIKIMSKRDRVRARKDIIFGNAGAQAAAKMILAIFLTEAQLGYLDTLSVQIYNDGSISINGNGRALQIEREFSERDSIFTDLVLAPREPDEKYYAELVAVHDRMFGGDGNVSEGFKVLEDHRFELACVQYASEFFRAKSVKNGEAIAIDFKKGSIACDISIEKSELAESTFIHFLPDIEVFEENNISLGAIEELIRKNTAELKSFTAELTDSRNDNKILIEI